MMTTSNEHAETEKNSIPKCPKISNFVNLKNGSIEKLLIYNQVPSEIELQNIKCLNLSDNQLKELPHSLSNLKNLEYLELRNNELTDLPDSYSKLLKLQELDISRNRFTSISKCIAVGMGTLKKLNISNNPHIKMNIPPFSKYLEKFYASDNGKCCKFPSWVLSSKFFNFREFNLDRTTFEVYSFVGMDRELNIASFTMTSSNLSSPLISIMIENMVKLKKINLGNENSLNSVNIFDSIPVNFFKNPSGITELNFRGTNIPFVSKEINLLKNLKILDLGCNNISWFPDEFSELQELEYLKIDGNDFLLFPENIGNLKSLKELRAEKNCISKLPNSFKNLKSLVYCDLYDNIFEEFPKILLEMNNLQGLDLEMNYFSTDNMTEKDLYHSLRKTYISSIKEDLHDSVRSFGPKFELLVESDGSDTKSSVNSSNVSKADSDYELESAKTDESLIMYKTNTADENWDETSDSDDNFEPESPNIKYYYEKTKRFIHPTPLGFCPADFHSARIKHDVACMRAYGSLPTVKVVEGQFDNDSD